MSSPADSGESKQVSLDPERLARHLHDDLPCPSTYWVAFSGGLDSTALLHALAEQRDRLRAPLRAVHVDHGLQSASGQWAAHCERVCGALRIPLTQRVVDARPVPGQSPEAAARQARYAAIGSVLDRGDMLLTAHHQDDQAETLLLQLMRGAGVAGLAAMPELKPFARGWHARPLLGLTRATLRQWVASRALQWIEDPSNDDTDADRNYVRHVLLPVFAGRWPAAIGNIATTAGHAAAALGALQDQAEDDLAALLVDRYRLDLEGLADRSTFRQRAALMRWFASVDLPPPSSATLAEIQKQLLHAEPGSQPCFQLGRYQLRRFRDLAWLMVPPPPPPGDEPIEWPQELDTLQLPYGSVRRVRRQGGIASDHWTNGRVRVRFRTTGFHCRPQGRAGGRDFKALAQECGVPPWQRPWLPVLFIDGDAAAVANCCVCEPFGAEAEGWWVEWSVPTEFKS